MLTPATLIKRPASAQLTRKELPTHGLPANVIALIYGELEAALESLNEVAARGDSRRVIAVIVLLGEVQPEFSGEGRRPWRAIPWLDLASQLLQRMPTPELTRVREHVSAVRDLLTRD